jgi:hypothetical protein
MEACLSREKPRLGPLRGPGLREVPLQSRSSLQKGPGTYREALTDTKIAIFKENYPEDKLTKEAPISYPRRTGKRVLWDSERRTAAP